MSMTYIKCQLSDCGFKVSSVPDYITHRTVHMRPHTQAKNFLGWLGTHMDAYLTEFEEVSEVSELSNFQIIDNILYIEPNVLKAYHEIYLIYLKETCKNIPCWDCIQKGIIRTMPEKRYMKYKMERDGRYEPKRLKSKTKKHEYE